MASNKSQIPFILFYLALFDLILYLRKKRTFKINGLK